MQFGLSLKEFNTKRPGSLVSTITEVLELFWSLYVQFTDILLYGYGKEPVRYFYKSKEYRSYYRGCVFDLKYMRDAGTTSKGNLRAIKLFSRHDKCPKCTVSIGLKSLSAFDDRVS